MEGILNSQPITTVSNDPNDLEPLTSNNLLQVKVQHMLPPGLFHQQDMYSRRRWRQVQYLADLFWTRWVKEYLPLLQERQQCNRIKRNFIPGDIVLIVDSNAPRGSWLMARVLETRPGSRGPIRLRWWKAHRRKVRPCGCCGLSHVSPHPYCWASQLQQAKMKVPLKISHISEHLPT